MAGRDFVVQQTLERQIKDLYFNYSFDGTNFSSNNSYGFYALTKSAAGDYKLELSDKWVALRKFDVSLIESTVQDFTIQIKSYDLAPTTGRPYINFYTSTAGTPTDIPTGSSLMGKVILKNTLGF